MKLAPFPLAVAAALTFTLAACGEDQPSGAVPPSASTPTAPVSTPAEPTPSETPSEVGPTRRTKAELTKALLELKDLPSGFSLEPEDPDDESAGTFSSPTSKCKTLVKYLNSETAPGSKTSAARSFSGSQEGPYIDFGIDSMVTTKAVRKLQTSYKEAVESCKKVTMRVPDQGSSPMEVVEIPAPKFGEEPFAFKLTGTAGPLEGREFTAATTGIGDVILSVSILAGQEGELDGATEAAVEKARTVLADS
ncbi:hypothetical protein EV644_14818 [Kribbella orskensis]|uniref:PknH-like protein n=1 Tax=Kribbella orskensis TaxID=2512216 RepID=A0ABY2B884_9ACTN|nr:MULTISPECIES: hypothetical protein [Kribbella]TCN28541.1 hypothetical protein EV642_1503 [Kribbella sp. VKM Ac-2500]TCO08148.1 hypothetical protein EV644_14818 [Kribbella orskensis]